MSLRSFVTIVASPRPRVGKTLVARLLADFHLHNERKVAAFDVNADDRALTEFLPDCAAPADIADIKGQIALFDRLVADDGVCKIVDVGYPAFKPFFAVAKNIDLAGELRRREVAPVVLFMATPDATSVEAHAALRRDFPEAAIVPVHNEVLGSAQYRDKYGFAGRPATLLQIPALAPGLRRIIDRRPFSFEAGSAVRPDVPLEAHVELQRWLRRLFVEFREVELRVLLSDLQNSLQSRTQSG